MEYGVKIQWCVVELSGFHKVYDTMNLHIALGDFQQQDPKIIGKYGIGKSKVLKISELYCRKYTV